MSESHEGDPQDVFRAIADNQEQQRNRDRQTEAERNAIDEVEIKVHNAFEATRVAFSQNEFLEKRARCFFRLKTYLDDAGCLSHIKRDVEKVKSDLGTGRSEQVYVWFGSLFFCEENRVKSLIEEGYTHFSNDAFEWAISSMRDLVSRHCVNLFDDVMDDPNDDLMTAEQLTLIVCNLLPGKVSERTVKRCIGLAAEEGRGRGRKSRWHYLGVRDALSKKYTSRNFPTLREAKRQIYLLDVKKNKESQE